VPVLQLVKYFFHLGFSSYDDDDDDDDTLGAIDRTRTQEVILVYYYCT